MDELFALIGTNATSTQRVHDLIHAIQRTPTSGIGKPEALKHQLKGYWSRRINLEHRLVYRFDESTVWIFSLKGHYL
ncbi:MAG: Txe/YoeB family addiction module toxin [Cryomorphaceae bacterium]|nr:Txe/YoeB family addiction module toxin [Cryomorphaceae bacterium]